MAKRKRAPNVDQLLSALGKEAGPIRTTISFVFDCMGVADVAARKSGVPFMALMPSNILVSMNSSSLYEAHVRELVQRHKKKADLRPGTMAEIAGLMSKASLQAPLSSGFAAVYWRALTESVGDLGLEPVGEEPHSGFVDEEIAALRKKLRVEKRK